MLKSELVSMMEMYQESRNNMAMMAESLKKQELDEQNGIDTEEIDFSEEANAIKKQIEEMDKEFKEQFGDAEELKDKPNTINGILDKLKEDKKNFNSEEDIKIIDKKINVIEESLNLKRLFDYRPLRNKNMLKKDFKFLSREVQTKLAKNKNFVFDSAFSLNKGIKNLILDEKLKDKSKILTAFIYEFILTNKINEQAVFIYFFLNNISNYENLEEENKLTLLNSVNELAEKVL